MSRGFFIILFISACFFSYFLFTLADTTNILGPSADGGNDSASWTNTAGSACNSASCYLEVDESSGASCTNSDGDTSFIETSTNGANQTFDIDESSIPDNSTITAINITICAVRNAGGARVQTRRCIDGSCANFGSDINLGTGYAETTQSHTGLNITKSASTDLEIGVSNVTAKGARVSQIFATVVYTLAGDTTAPANTTDLGSSSMSQTSVTLTWTAPGDDGSTGTPSTYDIRYSTANITSANWSDATQATGEPTPAVAGSAESFNLTGLTANTLYYFALKTSDEVPNESGLSNVYSASTTVASVVEAEEESSNVVIPKGGAVSPRVILLKGQAYPGSTIDLFRKSLIEEIYNSVPQKQSTIEPDGTFTISYTGLLGGQYFVALQVKDTDGRSPGVISFNEDLVGFDRLTAENIFVPPTIGLKNTTVTLGSVVDFLGFASPESNVELYINDTVAGSVVSATSGRWSFATSTKFLKNGTHYAKARQINNRSDTATPRTSSFSSPRSFKISTLSLPKADFNGDDNVNITDWSIFLFRYNSKKHDEKLTVDLNDDAKVDITDFSIFLKTMKI